MHDGDIDQLCLEFPEVDPDTIVREFREYGNHYEGTRDEFRMQRFRRELPQELREFNASLSLGESQVVQESVRIEPRDGFGNVLIALHDFQPGEEIFRERPLLVCCELLPGTTIGAMYGTLSTEVQTEVQGFYAGTRHGSEDVKGSTEWAEHVWADNGCLIFVGRGALSERLLCCLHSRPKGGDGGPHFFPSLECGALFSFLCRASHSCSPNAERRGVGEDGSQAVVCRKPIAAGTEVTISYKGNSFLSQGLGVRRKMLREGLGFHCRCSRCCAEDPLDRQSDGCESDGSASIAS